MYFINDNVNIWLTMYYFHYDAEKLKISRAAVHRNNKIWEC